MIGLLIFLAVGVAVSNYGRPLQLAGVVVVATALLSLDSGESPGAIVLSSLIFYPFVAFIYMLVERYSESILATYGILLGAVAVMFASATYTWS